MRTHASQNAGAYSIFQPMVVNNHSSSPFTNKKIEKLATSPALPKVIFASRTDISGKWLPPVFSHDRGRTWSTLATRPWEVAPYLSLDIAIAPQTMGDKGVSYLVAACGNEYQPMTILNSKLGIFRAVDAGQSWVQEYTPGKDSACLYSWNVFYDHFSPSPAAPQNLYVAYSVSGYFSCSGFPTQEWFSDWFGVLMSRDAGVSWENLDGLQEVFPSPLISGRIYARNTQSYLLSDDGGQTWVDMQFPNLSQLALDPHNPAFLYGIGNAGGVRSENGGMNWKQWKSQPCSGQLMAHPTISGGIYLLCSSVLYRSKDGGDTWEMAGTAEGQLIAPDYGTPGRILWARDDGLWFSDDEGTSWSSIPSILVE